MRKFSVLFALIGLIALTGAIPGQAQPAARTGPLTRYVVLYADGASLAEGRAAVGAIGGRIVRENTAVGLATIATRNANFLADVNGQAALYGAARDRVIGRAPADTRYKYDEAESDRVTNGRAASPTGVRGDDGLEDPLSGLQWGNEMIDADDDGSYAVQQGDPGVLVAIIDTGIDASNSDLAPNFSESLSRNWTTDIPLIDGPCEEDPDGSCEDPANVDEGGHGSHVAGIVGAALNGLGTAGVAPDITLVNDRAGQDSGFFFLQPTVDALTYAGDIGADVANMSFYIDPWLYNCTNNPYDSPEAQKEQRTIIRATQRALTYAHEHGVTLVSSAGNSHDDLTDPKKDLTSPDYPPGEAYFRRVDDSCIDLPTEGKFVISVSALGVGAEKAYYSNYGWGEIDVAAPGGDRRWYYGTPAYNSPETRILSTASLVWLQETGQVDEFGNPTTPLVMKNCAEGMCAYYTWFQGTSMAGPMAAGVAALIVSEFGTPDAVHGGLMMRPNDVQTVLFQSAEQHACPDPRRWVHPDPTLPEPYVAFCNGPPEDNGFYGHGIVNALNAVTFSPAP